MEDWSAIRGGHAAENMSTLRRLAQNSEKGEKSLKIGVAAKRKRADWGAERLGKAWDDCAARPIVVDLPMNDRGYHAFQWIVNHTITVR